MTDVEPLDPLDDESLSSELPQAANTKHERGECDARE